MNRSQRSSRLHAFAAVLGGLINWCSPAPATPFLYNPGDLVLTLRQPGAASDLVVNLGRITQYTGLPADASVPITRLTPELLASAFPSLNGLRWSAAAANRPPLDPAYPAQTLWVTAPRTDLEQAAAPWLRKGQFVQGNAGAQIDAIGINAALTSSLLPGGPDNTAEALVLPVSATFPIGPVIGADGNYAGTFQGNVETLTPDDFSDAPSSLSRADLIELEPGTSANGTLNKPGRNLGFFELRADGSLTFRTAPVAGPPQPSILSITRNGGAAAVTFTTLAGFQYRLRSTDAVGLSTPIGSWTAGPSIRGTGAAAVLEDSSGDSARFYTVEALP